MFLQLTKQNLLLWTAVDVLIALCLEIRSCKQGLHQIHNKQRFVLHSKFKTAIVFHIFKLIDKFTFKCNLFLAVVRQLN